MSISENLFDIRENVSYNLADIIPARLFFGEVPPT